MARHYSDWLQAYLQYTAHLEAPTKMHFWSGAVAIAGALQRKVWIPMGDFDWVPNFYVVLVAPPAVVAKSTTAGVAMRILQEVPSAKFGPDAATWQALVESVEQAQDQVEIDGEIHPMACVTLSLSEFGTLLDTENKQLVDILTGLWDGSKTVWRKVTRTQGNNTIINPWINMIACTTPAWIAENFSQQAVSGGFMSRCVFVYADKKRFYRALPDEHIPPDHAERRQKLIEDLQDIATIKGPFTITRKARKWINDWYVEHHKRRAYRSVTDLLSGYMDRKQVQMMKLSMVLSAACRNDRVIDEEIVSKAEMMVTALEEDMPRVFSGVMAQKGPLAVMGDCMRVLEVRKELAYKELYRQFYTRVTPDEFDRMLRSAQRAGIIRAERREDEVWLSWIGRAKATSAEELPPQAPAQTDSAAGLEPARVQGTDVC